MYSGASGGAWWSPRSACTTARPAPGRSATGPRGSTAAAATSTEAVRAVARWAFTTLGARRLEWRAEVGNDGFPRLAREGRLLVEGVLRSGLLNKGVLRDAGSARCSRPIWALPAACALSAGPAEGRRHRAPGSTWPDLSVSAAVYRADHDDCCRRPPLELSADEARRIALRAQGFLGAPDRRGGVRGRAAPPRRGPAGHDLGAGPLARADSVRTAGRRRPQDGRGRRTGLRPAAPARPHAFEYWSHAACVLPDRGVAALRLPPPRLPGPRRSWHHELADGALRRGDRPAARRGPADRHGAGRRQERRRRGGTGRRRRSRSSGADVRRGGVHRAARLEAGLRPGGARRSRRPAPRRPGRHGVPAPAGAPRGRARSASAPAPTSRTTTGSRASRSTR